MLGGHSRRPLESTQLWMFGVDRHSCSLMIEIIIHAWVDGRLVRPILIHAHVCTWKSRRACLDSWDENFNLSVVSTNHCRSCAGRTYRYHWRPSGKCSDESKKWISFGDAAMAGWMERNFRRARVPHFFTPMIMACGSCLDRVASVGEQRRVAKIQRIPATRTIPLRQLTGRRQHLIDIRRVMRWPTTS